MDVLCHHIYEYRKGLRNLVLHTLNSDNKEKAIKKLEHREIKYIIREVTSEKINIFFGEPECVEVVERFGAKPLNEFTPEQDFILGVMLGYNRMQQCSRYLGKIN